MRIINRFRHRATLSLLLAMCLTAAAARAQAPEMASAYQLTAKAFEALKAGKFELTNDYLAQAAALSNDPVLAKMAGWTQQFEAQRRVFQDQRRREYARTVDNVRLLVDRGHITYAMEQAANAYSVAEDKAAFRNEPWVVGLIEESRRLAQRCEEEQQWLKSLRLYAQLSAIEPDNLEWRERWKTSTRRVRLIAVYAPEALKQMQDAEMKEREAVDALLNPAAKATTRPAEREEEEAEQANRVDWRESLRGVRMGMLRDALIDAKENYYQSVTYRKMILGGLEGLRLVLSTPPLEGVFPGLANRTRRAEMLGAIDASVAQAQRAREEELLDILARLKLINDATVALPEEVFVSEFAEGAFSTLDPFSNIIWPSEWDEFQKTTQGQFSGVGIQIQSDDAGNLKVVMPIADTPAYEAGIKPDYIITHINGKSARWLSTSQAVKLITGPPDTTVTLTIRTPSGNVSDVTLTRRTIKVASIKGWLPRQHGAWDYFIDSEQRIAYLRLTNFSKTTVEDLNKALADIRAAGGARGIIFDLRNNPGGLLNAATDVADRFISAAGKVIVTTRPDRPDSPNQHAPPIRSRQSDDDIDSPLIVLVNQFSASASEIVSGALQDYGRSLYVVGERTFGKGSVQMLYPLGQQQAVLKLTTSHYYLPNGRCIHREENSKEWGVDPDVVVEMTRDQMRAAMEARLAFDIPREDDQGRLLPPPEEAGGKRKDLLESDPQLSAALLLMRLHLAAPPGLRAG